MTPLLVYKNRTNRIFVSFGFDISADTFTSEIRVEEDPESQLIATWGVSFASDGVDGELILLLDYSVAALIEKTTGYMDIKRVTGGEPVPVFDEPLEVLFKKTVTA